MTALTLLSLRGNRVAYVAQSAAASLNPAWKLITQFCEDPHIHGTASRDEAEAFARDLYEQMHLPDLENFGLRFPHQVSGWQLQRAKVAMAMACKPDLIVFDEPTTALDVTTQIGVLAAIRDVVEELGIAARNARLSTRRAMPIRPGWWRRCRSRTRNG